MNFIPPLIDLVLIVTKRWDIINDQSVHIVMTWEYSEREKSEIG